MPNARPLTTLTPYNVNRALRTIARLAHDRKEFPSQREIRQELNWDKSTVVRLLDTLEDAGEIRCRKNSTSGYRLNRTCTLTRVWHLGQIPVMTPGSPSPRT